MFQLSLSYFIFNWPQEVWLALIPVMPVENLIRCSAGTVIGTGVISGLRAIDLAQTVGAVFEDPTTQLTATSVENEIAFALENLRVPPDEIRARISPVLATVRLQGTEQKHPQELSGGQQQRLAIAGASPTTQTFDFG